MIADVYFKHKVQLLRKLPLEDPIFIARLQEEGLLRHGDLAHVTKTKRTRARKVDTFLTLAIEPSVMCDETTELEKLLLVMEGYDDSCERLAHKIRRDLNIANIAQSSSATG